MPLSYLDLRMKCVDAEIKQTLSRSIRHSMKLDNIDEVYDLNPTDDQNNINDQDELMGMTSSIQKMMKVESKKSDVHSKDNEGFTPFQIASFNNDIDTMKSIAQSSGFKFSSRDYVSVYCNLISCLLYFHSESY